MAKIRIGFSTHFEIENELAGIGTDNPTNTKQVLGNIQSSDAKVIGVTTLTTYQGFTDTKARIEASAGAKQHTTSGEIIIEGTVNVSSGTTFTSGPENLTVTDNFTLPGISDDKPTVGTMRFNEDLGSLEFYTGSEWRAVNSYVDVGNRGRGVFSGFKSPATNMIQFIEIMSKGNAVDFGVNTTGQIPIGNSDGTRGTFSGGAPAPYKDTIEYVTIASQGDAIDFGNLTQQRAYAGSSSSSTRGLIIGGYFNPTYTNIIDYIEIQTLGNAIDFGDCIRTKPWNSSTQSPTRGVYMSGSGSVGPSTGTHIEYVTMASKGNGMEFGDSTQGRRAAAGGGNSVRGIFCGGYLSNSLIFNTIDYVTLASTGNAVDFGDQVFSGSYSGAASTSTRMVTVGGYDSPNSWNIIAYITIATTGNAQDFGDCTVGHATGGVSDSHGGLGGF